MGKYVGMGGSEEKCGEVLGKGGKVCWDVGEMWECGKVLGKVWKSVMGCGRDVGCGDEVLGEV